MSTKPKHTPTPWEVLGNGKQVFGKDHLVANCEVCLTEQDDDLDGYDEDETRCTANAEFIIRACNCHDKLVEALEDALTVINDLDKLGAFYQWGQRPSCALLDRLQKKPAKLSRIEAVLAEAKGEVAKGVIPK